MLHGPHQASFITHSKFRANWSAWIRSRKLPVCIVRVSGARPFSRFSAVKSDENKLSALQQPFGVSNTNLRVRTTIRRLLARCNIQYKVVPLNHAFYQECFDVAVKRGYPVSSECFSATTFLRVGADYGATAGAHGTVYGYLTSHAAAGAHDTCRALQIWVALYTAYATFADDIPSRCSREMDSLRTFNDQFVRGEKQGNPMLDALADLLREAPRVFGGPVPANLVTRSTLGFIAAIMIEVETKDMQISASAWGYPTYQRVMSAAAEAYAVMVFPPDIPYEEYVQAVPEIALFICTVNDVLSFYKEELVGESTNHVATMAARKGISRVEAFEELADTSVELYERAVNILEGLPRSGLGSTTGVDHREQVGDIEVIPRFSRASEAFKRFVAGYFAFHFSSERYRLMEVGL